MYDVESVGLQELFEDHTVMSVFPSRHANAVGLECSADGSVAEDVIRGGWFFDEPRRSLNEQYEASETKARELTMA